MVSATKAREGRARGEEERVVGHSAAGAAVGVAEEVGRSSRVSAGSSGGGRGERRVAGLLLSHVPLSSTKFIFTKDPLIPRNPRTLWWNGSFFAKTFSRLFED